MDGEDGAKRCLQSDALQFRSLSERCDTRALSYQDTARAQKYAETCPKYAPKFAVTVVPDASLKWPTDLIPAHRR